MIYVKEVQQSRICCGPGFHVTAFVPGGDTLISSRSLTMIEKRDRVFTILDSMLRQRFTDMRYVGLLLLTAHPSSKWMDPAFSPQKEKVVVVYSEEVLQGSASVLLQDPGEGSEAGALW